MRAKARRCRREMCIWEKPTLAAMVSWPSSWKNRRMMTSRSNSGSVDTRPGRANKSSGFLPGRRCSHQIAKTEVGFGAGGLVQRHLTAAGHRGRRLQYLLLPHLQALGQLEGGGRAAQALVQLVGRPAYPKGLFLE